VVASSFAAVTVLLARFVLKEPMSLAQWAGIAIIVVGVGALSALRA
jgi:drug/metabolite transporter (DMT)-like permease